MHLTNYAINKRNENFVQDDAVGSKRYRPEHMPSACPAGMLPAGHWFTSIAWGWTWCHRSVLTTSCPPLRKLSTLNAWMMDNGYNTAKLWENIEDIIIKTLISAHPVVKHNYQSCFLTHAAGCACFEILGFDILLDRRLKPWLLEVRKELRQLWEQQSVGAVGGLRTQGRGMIRTHLIMGPPWSQKPSGQGTRCGYVGSKSLFPARPLQQPAAS